MAFKLFLTCLIFNIAALSFIKCDHTIEWYIGQLRQVRHAEIGADLTVQCQNFLLATGLFIPTQLDHEDHGVALLEISEEIRRKNSQQWIQQVEQVARRLVGIITDQQRQTNHKRAFDAKLNEMVSATRQARPNLMTVIQKLSGTAKAGLEMRLSDGKMSLLQYQLFYTTLEPIRRADLYNIIEIGAFLVQYPPTLEYHIENIKGDITPANIKSIINSFIQGVNMVEKQPNDIESIVQLFVYNDKIIAKLNLLSMLEYSIMQPVMEQQLIKILKFGRDGSQHRQIEHDFDISVEQLRTSGFQNINDPNQKLTILRPVLLNALKWRLCGKLPTNEQRQILFSSFGEISEEVRRIDAVLSAFAKYLRYTAASAH